MVQDAKEEKPPEVPDEISKLSKYKTDADRNPRELFWEIVRAYKEKSGLDELLKKSAKLREALVNIGATVLLEDERTYHVKMAKAKLAECILDMVIAGGWKDVLDRLLDNLYDRRRGPNLNMMLALGHAAESRPELLAWMKELLGEGRPSESVLAYVSHLGDRRLVEALKEQLMFIAKSEINEPQLYALEALSVIVREDAQVKKVFIDLMDDWDVRAKKVVLENLSGVEDADVGRKAMAAYVYEFDPYSKNLLKEIIKNNKEAARGEFGKYAGKYNEKVNKELRDLAESVYGKKAAKELIGELGTGSGKQGTENRKLETGKPVELP
ncbi:hypothetical protein H0O01_04745 [Candidatus Micrarchaeota archaeon]|nr:hypothetical protein [Candidatus Micrarchaeota archaeon]